MKPICICRVNFSLPISHRHRQFSSAFPRLTLLRIILWGNFYLISRNIQIADRDLQPISYGTIKTNRLARANCKSWVQISPRNLRRELSVPLNQRLNPTKIKSHIIFYFVFSFAFISLLIFFLIIQSCTCWLINTFWFTVVRFIFVDNIYLTF